MTNFFDLMRAEPAFFIAFSVVLGLMIGSFLNVVIHRLPKMMEREWQRNCAELQGEATSAAEPYSLVAPRSACPHCGHRITALENIPVLSYAWLRGKCSACRAAISLRYPFVELLTGLL
ncbi:MAG TPA: prepilin peptidase, partial [Methylophilaceae bacterium]|nr:prepilin peptidase [Methylophilaceae bacterium]